MAPMSLGERLVNGLVPSCVPALVLILALGIAAWIGDLSGNYKFAAEQIAGGALLITYIKDLFPKVMEQGKSIEESSRGKCGVIVITMLIVFSICTSAFLQNAASGFPGMTLDLSGDDSKFTAVDTLAYFIGFFVDGIVLTYDDTKIECNRKLIRKMMLSMVFSVDNLLDGVGLVPVLKDAFGGHWWVIMVMFSGCVFAGAICAALVQHYVRSQHFHLLFFSVASTSIIVGALELIPKGLSVWVLSGMAVVWVVLSIGDVVGEDEMEDKERTPDAALSVPSAGAAPRRSSLIDGLQHHKFVRRCEAIRKASPSLKRQHTAPAGMLLHG